METFFTILLGAGAIQGLFMAFALVRRERGRNDGEAVLAVLMLVFSANILHAGFPDGFRSISGWDKVPGSYEPFQLFFGPLSYLYVRLLAGASESSRRLKLSDLWHFIPAVIAIPGIPLLAFILPDGFGRILDLATWGFSAAYLLAYLSSTSREVHGCRERLREEYSDITAADLGWVRFFMIAFLAVEILALALFAWMVHGDPERHFGKLLAFTTTLLAYGLGYRGLIRRSRDLGPRESRPENAEEPTGAAKAAAPKYSRSGLDRREAKNLETELRRLMDEDRPWLKPEFSLQDLAGLTGSPRNQLSQVINSAFGKNFYDFVNDYRVREARRLLEEASALRPKMIAIAFDAGFASKPTFNSAFKKATGRTPSQYRSGLEKKTAADRGKDV